MTFTLHLWHICWYVNVQRICQLSPPPQKKINLFLGRIKKASCPCRISKCVPSVSCPVAAQHRVNYSSDIVFCYNWLLTRAEVTLCSRRVNCVFALAAGLIAASASLHRSWLLGSHKHHICIHDSSTWNTALSSFFALISVVYQVPLSWRTIWNGRRK